GAGIGSRRRHVMHGRGHGAARGWRAYRYSRRVGGSCADRQVDGGVASSATVVPLLDDGVLISTWQRHVSVQRCAMHRIEELVVHVNAHGGHALGAGAGGGAGDVMDGRGDGGIGLGTGDSDGGKCWDRKQREEEEHRREGLHWACLSFSGTWAALRPGLLQRGGRLDAGWVGERWRGGGRRYM